MYLEDSSRSLPPLKYIPELPSLKVSVTTNLKGNITSVCAYTANAAWFFPAIIVVTSNVTQKRQCHISRLLVSGFYALNTLYGTCVTWEFWFANEISKRRLQNALLTEQFERQVLFCNVTSRLLHDNAKIHATLRSFITSWKIDGIWKTFSAETLWSRQMTSWFYSIFQYDTTRSSLCENYWNDNLRFSVIVKNVILPPKKKWRESHLLLGNIVHS